MKKLLVSKRHLDNALASGARICINPDCGDYYIVVILDTSKQESTFKRHLLKHDVVVNYWMR